MAQASAAPRRANSRSRLARPGSEPIRIDFNTLEATLAVMDVTDGEYQASAQIFLSSRYQTMAELHRQYKSAQLVTKDQWVEFWTQGVEDPGQRIRRQVADKLFHTCSFLAQGQRGMTPTEIDTCRKTLSREFAKVTSTDRANQQKLLRYSWFGTDEQRRDISRPSQVLTPQKYEEMIARLKADIKATRRDIQLENESHQRNLDQIRQKLGRAKEAIKRLKAEKAELSGSA